MNIRAPKQSIHMQKRVIAQTREVAKLDKFANLDKGWKRTVKDAVGNREWDKFDSVIKSEVHFIERKLNTYKHEGARPSVDWKFIKALMWTESGGPKNKNDGWTKRPMQIGNPEDGRNSGLYTVKRGDECSRLIIAEDLKIALSAERHNEPEINVRTGIIYFYVMLIKSCKKLSERDPKDKKVYTYIMKQGDILRSIAISQGTTVEILIKDNNIGGPSSVASWSEASFPKRSLCAIHKIGTIMMFGKRPGAITKERRFSKKGGDDNYISKISFIIEKDLSQNGFA